MREVTKGYRKSKGEALKQGPHLKSKVSKGGKDYAAKSKTPHTTVVNGGISSQ
jgi:hypothetical protein